MGADRFSDGLPLRGIRVLSLEAFVAGPFATMLLADAGAEVIKVEPPGAGEPARSLGPFVPPAADPRGSVYFARLNRNKKSLTLNLKHAAAGELLQKLIGRADVFLVNLKPGTVERLGLSYRALQAVNPRLIYVAISGFGHRDLLPSPLGNTPAFDMLVQGLSGLMHQVGTPEGPPLWLGFPLGDIYPGTLAAYGAMLALVQRAATGKGQLVDISMYDALALLNERMVAQFGATGEVPPRGSGHGLFAPYGSFRAQDGHLVIAVATEEMWKKLCEAMGQPDLATDPRFRTGADRVARLEPDLRAILEAWLADKPRAEATRLLQDAGVPAGPVQSVADLASCPHLQARRMLVDVEEPSAGKLRMVGNPVKLEDSCRADLTNAIPRLGEHTEEVLSEWLGLSRAEIEALREKKSV